jgi:2-polyprenyl-3-methyl-5-hydroxy-6-metoxy-1,4-benzoquinol methylase
VRDRLIQSWTENAAAWTTAVRGGHIESREVATAAAILDAILVLAPKRVLDVGCGEGWLCRALSGHGIEAVGIDVSAPLVEAARAAGGGRFERLPYSELGSASASLGRFDTLACNFSLLEEDIGPMLADLRSLIAPRGQLVIQTVHPWTACGEEPYRDGWRLEDFSSFGEHAFPEPMPWYFRTLSSWLSVLSIAGYRVLALAEPAHPETARPLSLLLSCAPSPSGPASAA